MKKAIPFMLITLVFLVGIGTCLYPTISTYINKKNESCVIENQQNIINAMSREKLDEEYNAAITYNKSLAENHIVLTDPFDPNALPITDGVYEDLLTHSDVMAFIEIPRINVKLPIYHGTDEKTLLKGVGHLKNTSLPCGGEKTHTVLSAHTGLPSQKLFSDLDKVVIGDVFYIYVLDKKLSYCVNQIKIVNPNNSSDLMIVDGQDYVTLVTCTPYGKNTHRLLVRGTRMENEIAEHAEIRQEYQMSLTDKILMNFGISLRELIVFAAVAIMTVAFIVVMIVVATNNEKRKKNEKIDS